MKPYRNKLRILTSYFNQYCSMIDEKDKQSSTKKEFEMAKEKQKQEALIDQLEMLVYKK